MIVAVATGNPGKLREIRAILGGRAWDLVQPDRPVTYPEEGDDYETNAVAKASCVASALGVAALADDSGLEVDALEGGPGPLSARFGGPGLSDAERTARLLEALRDVPREKRTARFVCLAALVEADGRVTTVRGACEGRILSAARGADGFGYDPVFWIPDLGAAVAELPASQKNAISHRARAFRALVPALEDAQSRAKISSGAG